MSPSVHAVLDTPALRSKAMWRGGSFGDALDQSLLVSVDRSSGRPALVPETSNTTRALDPQATGWHRRAGEVLRSIVDYADRTGRPLEGLGLGTTPQQFIAARSTSAMQELALHGTLDAESAASTIRSTDWSQSLHGTHERGRIFLTPIIANALLHPQPSRIAGTTARGITDVIDHELGHVANARTAQPLSSGAKAEAIVELRTQVGDARVAPLQLQLGFTNGAPPSQKFYEQPVTWLRGVFHRAGSTTDAAIAADLAHQPNDQLMYTELAARLLDAHGIDHSWLEPAAGALSAPEYFGTAESYLSRLDNELANTPRGITFDAWKNSRG